MKRLFIFVLALFCYGITSAQLTRTVYGISLGAPESKVLQQMSTKQLTIETQNSQHGKIISGEGDVIFAGESWDAISVTIRNGKVYGIMFVKEKEYEEGRQLLYIFSSLGLSLVEKYESYAKEPQSVKYSYGMDDSLIFVDDKTSIVLSLKIRPSSKSILTLGYVDNPELDNQSADNANEL